MLFNYTFVSFTLSNILPLIYLCSLSLRSLFTLSLPISLYSLPISLYSPPGEKAERDQKRKQREIRRERAERDPVGLENEREKRKRDRGRKIATCAWRPRTTTLETTSVRTARGVLLLSIGERYVFFVLLGTEQGDDCEVAERMICERIWGFFGYKPGEYGGYKKSIYTVT